MPRPGLVIISGPPGAGKSHLVQALARKLGYTLDAGRYRVAVVLAGAVARFPATVTDGAYV